MTSRPAYAPEALTDFSKPENVKALKAAIDDVTSQLGASYPNVIGGERFNVDTTLDTTNPANPAELIGTVPNSGAEEADRAIAAATKAFPAWAAKSFEERAEYLFKAADIVRKNRHTFSAWMVKECGKNFVEADADTAEAIDFLDYYAREAIRYGAGMKVVQTADKNECFYIPLGVGAIIAPWNFPFAILCGMTTAAIVAGNTVVIKPAEDSSVIGYKFMELMEQVGVPPGVINFLTGDGAKVGARMVEHPDTRFISFTGSKAVGLLIQEVANKRVEGQRWMKRVVAEMGGKDAMIIDEDADLNDSADAIVAAAFGFQGQKCSACSRAIIHERIYDKMLPLLKERAEALKLGDPADVNTPYGPVINEEAYEKTQRYIAIGKKEGKLLTGGSCPDRPGWFIDPTIIYDVAPGAKLEQEEVFGPLLAVIKARDWDHAIEIANGTDYGLTGGVMSNNPAHLEDAKRRFHVGNLYLNRKCTGALVGAQPFGGYKMSGTCSKAGGPDYLGLFLQQKAVATRE